MDRLQNLENLVKELRAQLERAKSSTLVTDSGPATPSHDDADVVAPTSEPATHDSPASCGRLVGQDGAGESRYVGNAFWSRIAEELEALTIDTSELDGNDDYSDVSDGNSDGQQDHIPRNEPAQPQSYQNHFLFQQRSSQTTLETRHLHPPSLEVPFLLDTFAENVNLIAGVVCMPQVKQLVRAVRNSGPDSLTASREALLFSVYYAAVASMEYEDVQANFGRPKAALIARYRSGLELSLTAANFLSRPNIELVQAFTIFLSLARRHENPRSIYMLTALLVRMAQYLGLHRDGSQLEQLTPFEIQMRRRIWWTVAKLDARAAEDQGSDLCIAMEGFDTELPRNLNESDLTPDSTSWPSERQGVTDMTFVRITAKVIQIHRELMTHSIGLSARKPSLDLHACRSLIAGVVSKFEREYLQHVNAADNIFYWVCVTIARLVTSKLLLLSFLPILFRSDYAPLSTSPDPSVSEATLRKDLFRAAIEVAEYNHALNDNNDARQWRWIYQGHTHWYSAVYLMVSLAQRHWSPLSERAFVALSSPWLFPRKLLTYRNFKDKDDGQMPSSWVPLRQLMMQIRKHREVELRRLRDDAAARKLLEEEDAEVTPPSSPGPAPWGGSGGESSAKAFVSRWRELMSNEPSWKGQHHERPIPHDYISQPKATVHQNTAVSQSPLQEANSDFIAYQQPSLPHMLSHGPIWPGTKAEDFPRSHPTSTIEEATSVFDDFIDVDFDAGMEPPLRTNVNWYNVIQSAQSTQNMEGMDDWFDFR